MKQIVFNDEENQKKKPRAVYPKSLQAPKDETDIFRPLPKKEEKPDMVNHPPHYKANGMEVIDVIKAFTADLNGIKATDTGNAIKYILRWNKKANPIEDIDKAIWYLTHLKNELLSERTKENEN